jgi:hypothetical protein
METVDRGGRRARLASLFTLVLATACAGLSAGGCRVNEDDVHRWEGTAQGPDKLKAVLRHDKYETSLRVESALSLIRMKPRQGRRVGVQMMVETLAQVSPETRQAIVTSLVPAIIAELKKPPPVAQAGQPLPPDGSFPYKDAAYLMLVTEGVVSDEELKRSLKDALIEWAMADFEHRLDNRSQAYGMEQLLRTLGPSSVAGLPKLMTREAKRLDAMATLTAELGDPATKEAASAALVAIAKYVASDEWMKAKKPELEAANAASKLTPNADQFKAQLAQYQDEELFRVFASMKKLGGRPTVGYLLEFAANKDQSEKRRQAALAALEGNLDKGHPQDISRVLTIAASDAPDAVLDQAFRRIGAMPRELVIEKLYDMFKTDKWKVRRAAAATALRMSTAKNIDEFMARLPKGAAKGFAMPEALSYGGLFGDLKEGSVPEALARHMKEGSPAARASAIAYYFSYGTLADLPLMEPLRGDRGEVPVCETDADCKWVCDVPKEGAKDPKERESKDIKTIGDFVRFCVEPAMKERQPEAKKDEKK